MFEGQAIVTKYKSSASVFKVLIKPIDGRIIVGLDRQTEELMLNIETRKEGLELRAHREVLDMCAVVRVQALADTPFADIATAVNRITKVLPAKDWSIENRMSFINKYAGAYVSGSQVDNLLDLVDPLEKTEFDALKPRVSGLQDFIEKDKCATANRILFKEIIVELIGKSLTGEGQTVHISREILNKYATFDPSVRQRMRLIAFWVGSLRQSSSSPSVIYRPV